MTSEPLTSSSPSGQPSADRLSGASAAFLILIIVLMFGSWVIGARDVAGFSMTGWAWVVALVASGAVILKQGPQQIAFPLRYWMLWLVTLLFYWVFYGRHPDSLQTLIQLMTPFVVGCAASTFLFTPTQIDRLCLWLPRLVYVVLGVLLVKYTFLFFGKLPKVGMLTPEAITCCLLAAIYAAFFGAGNWRYLWCYGAMLLFPVVMMTRGPLMACAAAFPLSLSRLKLRYRVAMGGLLLVLSLSVFYSERYQKMMFVSGKGTLEDVRWDNPQLLTSGRKPIWETLWGSWQEQPWTGKGLNASRTVLFEEGYTIYLPHNDWLKLLHDLGIVGVSCFIAAIALQIFGLLRLARTVTGNIQTLAYAAASAFVPFMVVMITDNVTLYVQYYSNLHFALIGVVYGALRGHPLVARRQARRVITKHELRRKARP